MSFITNINYRTASLCPGNEQVQRGLWTRNWQDVQVTVNSLWRVRQVQSRGVMLFEDMATVGCSLHSQAWKQHNSWCDLLFPSYKTQLNLILPSLNHLTNLEGASEARRKNMLCRVSANALYGEESVCSSVCLLVFLIWNPKYNNVLILQKVVNMYWKNAFILHWKK